MFQKQAQEVIFSRKKNINNHPVVFFNSLPINRKSTQKHLGLMLDEKFTFSEYINEKLKKVTKSISLLRKLNLTLPRSPLLTFTLRTTPFGVLKYSEQRLLAFSARVGKNGL